MLMDTYSQLSMMAGAIICKLTLILIQQAVSACLNCAALDPGSRGMLQGQGHTVD